MNIRLQYDLEFPAGVYYDNRLQLNTYQVTMQLCTHLADTHQVNIALERLKCFVYTELANTVFIDRTDESRAEMLAVLGVNVTTLPADPVDQVVGIMLYCKLNAIMEGRMTVDSLNIASQLGDQVWYLHDAEDNLGMFSVDGWWHSPSAQHHTLTLDAYPDNVIQVAPSAWIEHGLLWPEAAAESSGNTVVFGNFPKNAN
jgi:hypothetical protein